MEIKLKIRKFLMRFFKESDLGDNDNIFELGIVNSLFAMQLVLFLEKEFNFEVENDEIDLSNFGSINSMANFIENKIKQGSDKNE